MLAVVNKLAELMREGGDSNCLTWVEEDDRFGFNDYLDLLVDGGRSNRREN